MITAAADGSALSNPGPAGWAWYVDEDRWAAGGWPHGTNNMGELMAVLDLLRQTAHLDDELHVLCDSQYAINCITKWTPGWKRRGWRKADGKPVMNVEILQELDAAMKGRRVSFEWVKGHAGHAMNERADELARAVATAYRDGTEIAHGPGFGVLSAGSMDVAPSVRMEPEDLFSVVAEEPVEPVAEESAGSAPTRALVTELVELTRTLLETSTRTSPERLEKLLDPELVRHDSEGRVQTYRRLLQGMTPLSLQPRIEVLGLDELGPDAALLRWRMGLGSRNYLVASLWVRSPGRAGENPWRLRFEQVTHVG